MRFKAPSPSIEMTPRQLQLLRMIADYQRNLCYSPTLAEMAAELNISRSTVYEHIGELRKKGLLSGSANKARSLKASSEAHELLSDITDAGSAYIGEKPGIPLAGRVAAGLPLEAVENTDTLSINSCFGNDDIFALEVQGDSMINDDIREGDYVICLRSNVARDGQLVIAVVDDQDATLKRFYRQKNRAKLQPANDNFEPIYSDNCRIEAVVVGLVRKF